MAIKLTKRQRELKRKYVSVEAPWGIKFVVVLKVGNQSFPLDYQTTSKRDANWTLRR